jgi:hypothetical protein
VGIQTAMMLCMLAICLSGPTMELAHGLQGLGDTPGGSFTYPYYVSGNVNY